MQWLPLHDVVSRLAIHPFILKKLVLAYLRVLICETLVVQLQLAHDRGDGGRGQGVAIATR